MPQPQFSGTPPTCTFGGFPLPNGQGVLSPMNLNDISSWFLQDFQYNLVKQVTAGQFLWRAKGTTLGRDFQGFVITLPMRYREATNGAFGAALAQLSQAGEQQLSFDGQTYILAEFAGLSGRKLLTKFQPYWWDFSVQFWCKTPWFLDMSSTTTALVPLLGVPSVISSRVRVSPTAGSASRLMRQTLFVTRPTSPTRWVLPRIMGVAPSFSSFAVTYLGSIFAEPVITVSIPSTNSATITSLTVVNLTSGESLAVTFPGGLAASTAYTLTIDCGAFTVQDASGRAYDVSGSFPQLYPPSGQTNYFTASVVTSSGTATGLTLTINYSNRWAI